MYPWPHVDPLYRRCLKSSFACGFFCSSCGRSGPRGSCGITVGFRSPEGKCRRRLPKAGRFEVLDKDSHLVPQSILFLDQRVEETVEAPVFSRVCIHMFLPIHDRDVVALNPLLGLLVR